MKIGRKLAFYVLPVIFVMGGISTYFYFNLDRADHLYAYEAIGSTAGRFMTSRIERAMLSQDLQVLKNSVQSVAKVAPVKDVVLLNREGIARAATDQRALGLRFAYGHPGCPRCHAEQHGILLGNENVYRWVATVKNKPQCHICHGDLYKYNGVLVIDFDPKIMKRHMSHELWTIVFFSVGIISSISLSLFFIGNKLVSRRLGGIMEKVKKIKEGDFGQKITVEGGDEITMLEGRLNDMLESIEERDREKDEFLRKIAESKQHWQETFDSITDMISIHDKDFRIIKANRKFLDCFGGDPNRIIGCKCYELLHATDQPVQGCPHTMTLKDGLSHSEELYEPILGRLFLIRTFPLFSEDGVAGSIHIMKDISEERENQMQLIFTERLAALGQIASGMAHEINNPLASIGGCAEALLERMRKEKFDPELFSRYLRIIEEEVKRCKSITGEALSFTGLRTFEKGPVNINDTIDKALELIGLQGRLKGVEVHKQYQADLPHAVLGAGDLKQILLILITNALDAMGPKGSLKFRTWASDNSVFIMISDIGPGIPEAIRDKIFTPFFTTKTGKGGTGLGLSIAKKIVARNGGEIYFDSAEGRGTDFTIKISL